MKHIKGIHPGLFLDWELKKRLLSKDVFSVSIGEDPQIVEEITLAMRRITKSLAFKIEEALGLEEGTLMILQVYYDSKEEKRALTKHIKPDLTKLRSALFWDANLENIDWIEHRQYVIDRVNERGTDAEKELIAEFYTSLK